MPTTYYDPYIGYPAGDESGLPGNPAPTGPVWASPSTFASNNTWTGSETFTGPVTFTGTVTGAGGGGGGLGSVVLSGTPSVGQVPMAVTGTTATWQTPPGAAGGAALDTNAAHIAPLGVAAAGAVGLAADSGHVHLLPASIATNTAAITAETTRATAAELLLAPKASPTFTGAATAPVIVASGLAGATVPTRYAGGVSGGPPVTGTWLAGDVFHDTAGALWVCTTGGTAPAGTVFELVGGPTLIAAAASTANVANITTSGGLVAVDGVVGVAGTRVLLSAQTTGSQNGLWIMNTGAWTRPPEFAHLAGLGGIQGGMLCIVTAGTANAGLWYCTTSPFTVDTTAQTWLKTGTGGGGGGLVVTGTASAGSVPVANGSGGTAWANIGEIAQILVKSTNYTMLPGDEVLASGNITLTLPATPAGGTVCGWKKVDAFGTTVTVSGGAALIDGLSSVTAVLPQQASQAFFDGTNWQQYMVAGLPPILLLRKTTSALAPSATANVNGASVTITPNAPAPQIVPNALYWTISAGVVGESITLTVLVTFDDATTATITPGAVLGNVTSANTFNDNTRMKLYKDGRYVVSLTFSVASTIASSTATVVVDMGGINI